MSKNVIIGVVLGLVLGGLGMWLFMSFSGVGGTMILGTSKSSTSANTVTIPQKLDNIYIQTDIGAVNATKLIQDRLKVDPDGIYLYTVHSPDSGGCTRQPGHEPGYYYCENQGCGGTCMLNGTWHPGGQGWDIWCSCSGAG